MAYGKELKMQNPKKFNLISTFKCLIKGHLSRKSSCPFTGYDYDICDRCGKTSPLNKGWIY